MTQRSGATHHHPKQTQFQDRHHGKHPQQAPKKKKHPHRDENSSEEDDDFPYPFLSDESDAHADDEKDGQSDGSHTDAGERKTVGKIEHENSKRKSKKQVNEDMLEDNDLFRGFRSDTDEDSDEKFEDEEDKNENHAPFSRSSPVEEIKKKSDSKGTSPKKQAILALEEEDISEDEAQEIDEHAVDHHGFVSKKSVHFSNKSRNKTPFDTNALRAMDVFDVIRQRYADGDESLQPKAEHQRKQDLEKVSDKSHNSELSQLSPLSSSTSTSHAEKNNDLSLSPWDRNSLSVSPSPDVSSAPSPMPTSSLTLTTGKFHPPREREPDQEPRRLPALVCPLPPLPSSRPVHTYPFSSFPRSSAASSAASSASVTRNVSEDEAEQSEQQREIEQMMTKEIALAKEKERVAKQSGLPSTTAVASIVEKIEQNVVAISIGKGLPFATGLMIHPSLCLTARHCIEGVNVSELIIRANFQKTASPAAVEKEIKNMQESERQAEREKMREREQERGGYVKSEHGKERDKYRDFQRENKERERERVKLTKDKAKESSFTTLDKDAQTAVDFWSHLDVLGIVEESLELDYTILLLRLPVQNFKDLKLHLKPFTPPVVMPADEELSEIDKEEIANNIATESAVFFHHPYGWTRKASVHLALDANNFIFKKETLPGYRDRDRINAHANNKEEVFAMHCLASHMCSSAYPVKHHAYEDDEKERESEIVAEMTGVIDRAVEAVNDEERERERERQLHAKRSVSSKVASSKGSAKMMSAKMTPMSVTHSTLSLHNLHLLSTFPTQSTHCHHTTALYLSNLYEASALLKYFYDREGKYLNRSLPESFSRQEFEKVSTLPRSEASKVYHTYVEAMKQKPKSFFSANQRYPKSLVQLTLHHIIPKSNMEFLWMLSRTCSEINSVLSDISWSKAVHEISLEGVILFRSVIDNNSYLKNLWESGVYSIEDSVSGLYVIIPFAVEKLQGVIQYHEAAVSKNASLSSSASQDVSLKNDNPPPQPQTPITNTAPFKIFLTHEELHTLKRILACISLSTSIPDHLNQEGSLAVNNVVWAPWNLFIGPSDRPIGSRPGYDAKEAYSMESTKPLSFPSNLWERLTELNALLTEAWKGCLGRVVTHNNAGKSMSQLRISSVNREELVDKFVRCLHELELVYTQICVDHGRGSERDYVHVTTDKDWNTAYKCVIATEYKGKERLAAGVAAAAWNAKKDAKDREKERERDKTARHRSESDISVQSETETERDRPLLSPSHNAGNKDNRERAHATRPPPREDEDNGYRSDASVRSTHSTYSTYSTRSARSVAGSVASERNNNRFNSSGGSAFARNDRGSFRSSGLSNNNESSRTSRKERRGSSGFSERERERERGGHYSSDYDSDKSHRSDTSDTSNNSRLTRAEKKFAETHHADMDNRHKKIESLSFDDMAPYTLYLRLVKALRPRHHHYHKQSFDAIAEEDALSVGNGGGGEDSLSASRSMAADENENVSVKSDIFAETTAEKTSKKRFDPAVLLLDEDDESKSNSLSRKSKARDSVAKKEDVTASSSESSASPTDEVEGERETEREPQTTSSSPERERQKERVPAPPPFPTTEENLEKDDLSQQVTLLVCSYREETEQDARHLILHTFLPGENDKELVLPMSTFYESTKSSMKVIDFAFSNGEDMFNLQRIAAMVKEKETAYKVSLDAQRAKEREEEEAKAAAAAAAAQEKERERLQAEQEEHAEKARDRERERDGGEGEGERDSLKSELDNDFSPSPSISQRSTLSFARGDAAGAGKGAGRGDEFRLADEENSLARHAHNNTHNNNNNHNHGFPHSSEGYRYQPNAVFDGASRYVTHRAHNENPHYNGEYHSHTSSYRQHGSGYKDRNNSYYGGYEGHYVPPHPAQHVNPYKTIELEPKAQVLLLRLVKQVNKILREHNFIGTYKLRVHDKDGEPAWALMPPTDV